MIRSEELVVTDVTKFAGFVSPATLVTDTSLSREDKISGLSNWHWLVDRLRQMDGDDEGRARLAREIEGALERLRKG